jgi:hypothetical protein
MCGEIKFDWILVKLVFRRPLRDSVKFGQTFPAEMGRLEMPNEVIESET